MEYLILTTILFVGLAVLATLLVALIVILITIPFRKYLPTSYVCGLMHWHYVDKIEERAYDGTSFYSRCSKCGKHVMLDSQGNWF